VSDDARFEATEQLLPGLEPPKPTEPALVKAARRSIVALEAAGYLDERHAVLCQLVLDMAEVTDTGRRHGRASAAAMAAAQLQAAYVLLMPEAIEGGEGNDEWGQLVAEIRRSTTPVRDQAKPAPQE
jgi:hypothetical protein